VKRRSCSDRETICDQIFPFAMSPPRLFVRFVRNRDHRTDARLTPQPGHQAAQQNLDVDDIRLRPLRPGIDRKDRRLHHMDINVAPDQKARQPKTVAAGLVCQDHPRDRMADGRAASLEPFDQFSQFLAACSQKVPSVAFNAWKLNGEHPFRLA
jgi:hypothetical protein